MPQNNLSDASVEPYTAKEIQSLRRALAGLRSEALEQSQMHWAVILSHVISVMWDYNVRVHGFEFACEQEAEMPADISGDQCGRVRDIELST